MQLGLLPKLGLLGLIYILMRALGKSLGAYFGAAITKASETVKRYVGLGLLPQAGVAIGLAIDASHAFRHLGAQGKIYCRG